MRPKMRVIFSKFRIRMGDTKINHPIFNDDFLFVQKFHPTMTYILMVLFHLVINKYNSHFTPVA